MRPKHHSKSIPEIEIDRIVVAQADDDSAWEEPVPVQRTGATSFLLPAELAARVAFFTRLHREASIDAWLKRIIQERLDLEEAAFVGLKREMAESGSP